MTSKNCGEQKNSRDASISFKLHLFSLSFKQNMFFFRILKPYIQLNFHFPLGDLLGNTTHSITSFLARLALSLLKPRSSNRFQVEEADGEI